MKALRTRIMSAFLVIMTLLTLLPTSALAASGSGTGIKPTDNTNYWTTRLLHDGTPYSYKPPMAAGKLLYCLDRGYGYRWGTASFLNSYTYTSATGADADTVLKTALAQSGMGELDAQQLENFKWMMTYIVDYKGEIPGSLFMAAQTYVWDHQTFKGEGDGDIDAGGFANADTYETYLGYCRMTERNEREAHGLWVTDPAEKQSRARLSEQMRGEMQGLLRLYRDIRSVGGQDSPYEAMILLSAHDAPEEYSRRMESMKDIPSPFDPKRKLYDRETGKAFAESFRRVTDGLSPNSIRAMSDQKLAENFPLLATLVAIKDGDRSLLSNLPEQESSFIKDFFNECDGALDAALWRAQTIASPYYQHFYANRFSPVNYDYDSLKELEEGEFFGEEVPDIELSSDLSEEEREKFECFCIQSHKSSLLEDRRQQVIALDAVKQQRKSMATASGAEVAPGEIKWRCKQETYMGGSTAPQAVVDALRGGRTAYAVMPDATVVAVSGKERTDGSISMATRASSADEIVNADRLATQKNMKQLAKELSDAHPWYKFSSDQFKAMKSAFESVQNGLKAMGDKPTEQQRREMQEKLASLSEKCQTYLDYKVGRSDSRANMLRTHVAEKIKAAADSFKASLGIHDEVNRRKQEILEEKRAAHEAWQEKTQKGFAEQKEGANAFQNREPVRNTGKAKTSILAMFNKCTELKGIPAPESDCGKTLENLKNEAVAGAPKLIDGAGLSSVNDRQRSSLSREMAAMVAFELILQERGDRFEGKAGPLEQKCAENQEAFISMVKRSPAFEHGVGEITPQRLEKFLMEDGARKVAAEIFRQAAERAPEKGQNQPGVQKKAEGPQKQL